MRRRGLRTPITLCHRGHSLGHTTALNSLSTSYLLGRQNTSKNTGNYVELPSSTGTVTPLQQDRVHRKMANVTE